MPGYSVYCASKFGLRGFAQALRREMADTPVRIQYLGPRSTRTPFNSEAVEPLQPRHRHRDGPPELVAQALVQLMEAETAERFLGFPETIAVRINGLVPGALDGAFVKHRQ